MNNQLSPIDLYRLPWNLADNPISWLEPTSKCNLYCDGCYRENKNQSHKSMDEIKQELEVFAKYRKTDSISIAGGEPLTHPQIAEIVSLVGQFGWKPTINSNGALLNEELLIKLKKAGVWGFTFHVDSGQARPEWKGKNELELNDLRYKLAKLLADAGGISCTFNATIYPENLKYVPELLNWAHENIDIVQSMVFIIYRMAILGNNLDFYVGDKQVKFDEVMYSKNDDNRRTDISSEEIVGLVRENCPDFMPCAFLNGTEKVDTYKWLLSGRIGSKSKIFGYVGPKFMEIVQSLKHIATGTYLAYSRPSNHIVSPLYFLLAPFDKGLRKAISGYFREILKNPAQILKLPRYQTVLIIQPADIYSDGRVNMCDGCPDITVWNGSLVWSCRMEEQNRWGQNVRVVPRNNKLESSITLNLNK